MTNAIEIKKQSGRATLVIRCCQKLRGVPKKQSTMGVKVTTPIESPIHHVLQASDKSLFVRISLNHNVKIPIDADMVQLIGPAIRQNKRMVRSLRNALSFLIIGCISFVPTHAWSAAPAEMTVRIKKDDVIFSVLDASRNDVVCTKIPPIIIPGKTRDPDINRAANAIPAAGQTAAALLGGIASSIPACPAIK